METELSDPLVFFYLILHWFSILPLCETIYFELLIGIGTAYTFGRVSRELLHRFVSSDTWILQTDPQMNSRLALQNAWNFMKLKLSSLGTKDNKKWLVLKWFVFWAVNELDVVEFSYFDFTHTFPFTLMNRVRKRVCLRS